MSVIIITLTALYAKTECQSAVHANFAIVFAQLFIQGRAEGIHAFLIPIRDEKNNPCSGVTIHDMGKKQECNGVDNGCVVSCEPDCSY